MLPAYVIRQAKKVKHSQEFPIYTPNTKATLMNAYFMSQFGYCPLVGLTK